MRSTQILARRHYVPTSTDVLNFFRSPRSTSTQSSYLLHPSIVKLQFNVPHVIEEGLDSFQPPNSLPEQHRESDHRKRALASSAAQAQLESLQKTKYNLSWQTTVRAKERLIEVEAELKEKELELEESVRRDAVEKEEKLVKDEREYDHGAHDLQLVAYDNPTVEIEFVHPKEQPELDLKEKEYGAEDFKPRLPQDILKKRESTLSIYLSPYYVRSAVHVPFSYPHQQLNMTSYALCSSPSVYPPAILALPHPFPPP
jgi:hypothetical protein